MSTAADLSSAQIGQIALHVEDINRATAFYRDVLGLPLLFAASKMAFFLCGEARLMLVVPEAEARRSKASLVYYAVDDIQATAETLRGRGLNFETDPELTHKTDDHELWQAFFYDSEGNLLALMSEVSGKPKTTGCDCP